MTTTVVDTRRGEIIPTLRQPQQAYMWEVIFVGTDMYGPDNQSRENDIKFYAKSASLPTQSQDVVKKYYAGVPYAYPSKDSSMKIFRATFWDNNMLDIYHFFQRWFNMTNDPRAKRKTSPEKYFRRIQLNLLQTDGVTPTDIFWFHDAFPIEIGEAELSYESSDPFIFDVQFRFSKQTMGNDGNAVINQADDPGPEWEGWG